MNKVVKYCLVILAAVLVYSALDTIIDTPAAAPVPAPLPAQPYLAQAFPGAEPQVFAYGVEVHLTPNEYKLLTVLMKNAGRVLTHRQLLKEVWGPAYATQTQYLRVYMVQLRHKLEIDSARPKYLVTEPGVGYRLKVDG